MTQPAALARCAACDAAVDPGALSCQVCGSPLGQPVRRLVAVLFADLAGYTAWCSTQDPEDVHLLVRPLMNGLRRVCESLDGSVTSIEGDGLMAVFGARRADEAAVRKAVVAAAQLLTLVDERNKALRGGLPGLKVGLHAGEVLVAPSWESTGFSVAGDTVNLARRVCEAAPVGTVLAHQVVSELVPSEESWGAVERVPMKGQSELVPVRALSHDRLAAALVGHRPLSQTPFVGRSELLSTITDAVASGPVALVGEPGVGKSRLALAWAQGTGRRPLWVRCPSFSVDGPWAPLRDVARHALVVAAPENERALRRLAGLVVDSSEPDHEDVVIGALAAALRALAATEHVVLLVEDAHEATRPVRRLLEELRDVPVVLTAREQPQGVVARSLDVPPLEGEESDALVLQLLGGADDEVRELLRDKCGGNPLFVEQCARLLLEDGLVEVAGGSLRLVQRTAPVVPTTMRLFVAARLEQLPSDEGTVLAAASVLGDVVDPALLEHLVGSDPADAVQRLVERNLLRWEASSEGRPHLRFAHALVRDVAYDGQLRSDRLARHLVAAEWYAVLPVASVLEAQAAHLEAAVRLGQPDCDLVRKTVEAMVLHARAINEERPAEAGDVLDRASALVAAHPACEVDVLLLNLVRLTTLSSAGRPLEAADLSQVVLDEARRRGEAPVVAEALLQRGRALSSYQPEEALVALDEAQQEFERLGDPASAAEVDVHRAVAVERTQGLGEFVQANRRAFDASRRAGDTRLQSQVAHDLAMHAFVLGRSELEEWLEVARGLQRKDDRVGPARLAAAEAGVALYARDDRVAVEAGVRAQQLGHRAGMHHAVANGLLGECEALVNLGRLDEAERRIAEAHELGRSRRTTLYTFHVTLVELALRRRQGRPEEARELRADLETRVREHGAFAGADLDERLALDALERGDFDRARSLAVAAIAAHRDMGHLLPAVRIEATAAAATVSGRGRAPLNESSTARREARLRGAPQVEAVLARWWALDDVLHGHSPALHDLPPSALVEARALDLDIAGLSEDPDALVDAARSWSQLGTTVFWARSLVWHETLTGQSHSEAADVLAAVDAAPGTLERLRAQAEGLRRS